MVWREVRKKFVEMEQPFARDDYDDFDEDDYKSDNTVNQTLVDLYEVSAGIFSDRGCRCPFRGGDEVHRNLIFFVLIT